MQRLQALASGRLGSWQRRRRRRRGCPQVQRRPLMQATRLTSTVVAGSPALQAAGLAEAKASRAQRRSACYLYIGSNLSNSWRCKSALVEAACRAAKHNTCMSLSRLRTERLQRNACRAPSLPQLIRYRKHPQKHRWLQPPHRRRA